MEDTNESHKRRLPACERCRSRKTKCDSNLPVCSKCEKAGVECIHKHKSLGKNITRRQFFSLEERLRSFEKEQASSEELIEYNQQNYKRARLSNRKLSPSSASQSSSPCQDQWQTSQASENDCSHVSLNKDNEKPVREDIDSLLATTFSIGTSLHVSDDIDEKIRQYLSPPSQQSEIDIFKDKEQKSIRKLKEDFLKEARRNNTRNRLTDITAYDFALLVRLAKRYFSWMNSAYPVLHECMFHLLLEKCTTKPSETTETDYYQLYMTMAISLASMSRPQLSVSEFGQIADHFWKSGIKYRSRALLANGITRLQNILLQLQYTLLKPTSGNLWQLSGTAMRYATEMGLYAEPDPSQDLNPLCLDLRRRIFWTCYCIDRFLSTVMGRPSAIPDFWISCKYPAVVEDKLITVHGIENGPLCYLKVAQVQQIRIYRLQSEIHKQLYSPGYNQFLPNEEFIKWSWQMYDQLRLWRNSFTLPTPLVTKEWTEFQFHLAVVLLFRPSPNRPKLSDQALHVAFHSAGEGMKLVKLLHREYSAVFSWLTIQNLFMCGLTFVNSLKELVKRRCLLCSSFVEIILQIQSCTAMLETFSTLEEGPNEKIRNVFEMVSSDILQHIITISSSLQQPVTSYEDCIWLEIAKSDKNTLSRPTQVEGLHVPIQEFSTILQQTDLQDLDGDSNEIASNHFYEHDMDAYSGDGLLNVLIKQDSFSIMKEETISENLNILRQMKGEKHFEERRNLRNMAKEKLPSGRNTVPLHSESNSVPVSNSSIMIEPNLGFLDQSEDELDRWFLYPLPEASWNFN